MNKDIVASINDKITGLCFKDKQNIRQKKINIFEHLIIKSCELWKLKGDKVEIPI